MILWMILSIASVFAQGSSTPPDTSNKVCLMLENLRFKDAKCVPSTREICHSGIPGNCEVQGGNSVIDCNYFRGGGVYYKPIDDWSRRGNFECVSRGDPICVGTGDSQVCQNGPCLKYIPPYCKRQCTKCYVDQKKIQVPYGGCRRFCSDRYCSDEPQCDNSEICVPGTPNCFKHPLQYCPLSKHPDNPEYVLPRVSRPICQNSVDCPTTVPVPYDLADATCELQDGSPCQIVDGQISIPTQPDPPGCTPEEPVEAVIRLDVLRCPWIEFVGNVPTRNQGDLSACEPIEVGNRFPTDCCECPNLPGHNAANCKSCGFSDPRYCNSFFVDP
ncbi:MAG: hypothetical protein KDD37_00020 [Bdellovibrionales bacterium]|nr:hypothetical protein [Bdellovibrionales bacterium]